MITINSEEIIHLLVSVVTISLTFSMFTIGSFPLVFLTVGLGFLVHEIGHRTVAKLFGAQAVYRAWSTGLMLAITMAVISFGRFIFAAPGSVYIYGKHLTRKETGIVALAGPLMNLLIAIVFRFFLTDLSFTYYGFQANIFLGIFNLMPFPPLDGAKVFEWSQSTWLLLFFFGIVLMFYP